MAMLLTLSHFCEIHGPSVVFHTRLVDGTKFNGPNSQLLRFNLAAEADSYHANKVNESDLYLFPDQNARYCNTTECEGCSLRSNTAKRGVLSYSPNGKLCFLTEDFANPSPIFFVNSFESKNILMACLRSLSSELYSKDQGGLYFSTENGEHVVSFLFSLQDCQARGFQRKYSICLLCNTGEPIFRNWNLLIKSITLIVAGLQKRAKATFKSELKPEACLNKRSIILDKVANAGKNLNYFEEIFHRDSFNTSKDKIRARSLGEISGDSNIFYTLHLQFASILAEIIKREEESTSLPIGEDSSGQMFDLKETALISNFFCNDYSKLRQLFSLTGIDNFLLVASNVVLGNRVIVFDSAEKGRAQLVVGMLAKLLPQERIQVLSQGEFTTECVSPSDSNLVGVCAKFQSHDMKRLIQDYFMCLEVRDAKSEQQLEGEKRLTPSNCLLKLHCCDKIASVGVPTFVKQVAQLLEFACISDQTMGLRIDEIKFEWMSKSRMFVKHAPRLSTPEVDAVKSVFNVADNDLQMMQFWAKAFLAK